MRRGMGPEPVGGSEVRAMELTVNGGRYVWPGGSLSGLLGELGADSERVAVVVNERVVPRAEWTNLRLSPGDHVDVVEFAGGG